MGIVRASLLVKSPHDMTVCSALPTKTRQLHRGRGQKKRKKRKRGESELMTPGASGSITPRSSEQGDEVGMLRFYLDYSERTELEMTHGQEWKSGSDHVEV